jgi:DNA-binding HxlR family transcriptional regulator
MPTHHDLAAPPLQPEPECEMFGLLEMLSGPWTMHILCMLSMNGPLRYNVLKRHIDGISDRLLTARLRVLEDRGLIRRSVKPTVPPEVTYAPTPRLDDMRAVVKQLNALAVKWRSEASTSGVTTLQTS